MNYIVLNGKNSRYIQGLLIQKLPPISKPQMRIDIEEIDGRDGDIITDLGYKTYDKTITVGLYRGYDINDVIDFFNSEGKVIFSNEPYLYYKYKIFQQIDFAKLVRFRTANVVMHVQPFKYSTTETPLTYEIADGQSSIKVINTGNYKSKPKMTIHGTGTIGIGVNGVSIFSIALGSEGYITIDTENLEAYKGNVLKNRIVTGNYDAFALQKGENIITMTGDVSEIEIENYSRWI